MFTLRNHCNNCYTSFSLLKLIWTLKNLTWCRFCFHNLEKVSELTVFEITRVNFIFNKAQFRCYGFPCIFYDVSFFFFFFFLSNRHGYFFTLSASDSFWLNKSGVFSLFLAFFLSSFLQSILSFDLLGTYNCMV